MYYLDPLYGQLDISKNEISLYQTEALARLRDVSLSAVPPFTWPAGNVASRFEHSVGVAFLAKKLCKKEDFKDYAEDLYFASLFHDVGSPPFSHITEVFQREITGKNHEEFVEEVLTDPDLKAKIKQNGGSPKTIIEMITGEKQPWSDLINGSIDLDNLDNTLRWGLGAGVFTNKLYEPEEILNAFIISEGKLALRMDYQVNIQKWELARRLAYELVYSDLNLAPGSMLFRALQFAYENGEIDNDFFYRTDSQAFYLLENKFNQTTRKIAKDIRLWKFYQPAAKKIVDDPSERIKQICLSWRKSGEVADKIAEELEIPREKICISAGKDKGFKKIHLPFVGKGEKQYHLPIIPLKWRIKVYLHPTVDFKEATVQKLLEQLIS
jgi:hypothetical protein